MTPEFKKAMLENMTTIKFPDSRHECYTRGANWAYEWMCDENHQFALYRKVQDSKLELQAKADKLAEALEFYANPKINDPRKFLVLSDLARDDLYESDHTRFAFGARAKQALKEYRGEND